MMKNARAGSPASITPELLNTAPKYAGTLGAETYVLHDIKVTEKGIKKGLSLLRHDEEPQPFYV